MHTIYALIICGRVQKKKKLIAKKTGLKKLSDIRPLSTTTVNYNLLCGSEYVSNETSFCHFPRTEPETLTLTRKFLCYWQRKKKLTLSDWDYRHFKYSDLEWNVTFQFRGYKYVVYRQIKSIPCQCF